jgi:glycosyltransferase involved in cell wall biosynthesis
MRLLLVVPSVSSFRSFLGELSEILIGKGVDVSCACSLDALWGDTRLPIEERVHQYHIPFPRGMEPLAHMRAATALKSVVRRAQPDLVHAHFSSAIFTTALAKRKSWPVAIGTFQGISFPTQEGPFGFAIRLAEIWAAKRLDKVWVLTDDDYARLHAAVPRATISRQEGWGFGCDLTKYDPTRVSATERAELRSRLGVTAKNIIFTFVGRFVSFKGFGLVVRAFLRLSERDPTVRLLLVGARDDLHATGLTQEEEYAMKSTSQIIHAGWQADVKRYLAITDVVVFPSRREGIPVSLMEALAMGVPVITVDSRGCRDVVRDQVDGIVLRDVTEETLMSAMSLLRHNRLLLNRLSSAALEGRHRFNRLSYIRTQVRTYEELVRQHVDSTDCRPNTVNR